MKKIIGPNSQSHTALINEYKGNLFEFILARELAAAIKKEASFLKGLPPNYQQLLRTYQNFIFKADPLLGSFLLEQGRLVAQEVLKKYSTPWEKVSVIGKMAANSQRLTSEADIILSFKEKTLPLSVKMSKKGSYLHTKSGGIRSFFTTYFPSKLSQKIQKEFNHLQDIEFSKLSQKLEEREGLEPSLNFSSWKKQGLPELPGALEGESKQFLADYYEALLKKMIMSIRDISKALPQEFLKGLAPLMGFANEKIIQVTMLYKKQSSGEYDGTDIIFHQDISHFLNEMPQIVTSSGVTSLYLVGEKWKLQLRVKPMNVFTTKAIKINCSCLLHL